MERFQHRSVRHVSAAVALLAFAVLTLGGCVTPSSTASDDPRNNFGGKVVNAWTLGPPVDDDGHHRSLAINSPPMGELLEIQPWLESGQPWYAGRVDRARQITRGVRSSVIDRAIIATNDRVDGRDGQVRDDFKLKIKTQRVIEVRP